MHNPLTRAYFRLPRAYEPHCDRALFSDYYRSIISFILISAR